MDFNCINDLIENDDASKEYFSSLEADVQQRLLDRYTGVANLDDLKNYANSIMNDSEQQDD